MGRYISLNTSILKDARAKCGHTQESLALQIGIRREAYSRIESTGSTQVTTAEKIAIELGVDLDYLTGTKRGEALFSPFACEFLYPTETGTGSTWRLFDKESDLLSFIKSEIEMDYPFLDGNLFPDFSTRPVPAFSYSPDRKKAELKLPLRSDEHGSSKQFSRFIIRELKHRETQGFVWTRITRWAQIEIEDQLQKVLNRYWPEYDFNGERRGKNSEFRVNLRDVSDVNPHQFLALPSIYMLAQFLNWLAEGLPKLSVPISTPHWGIQIVLPDFKRIEICRMDRDEQRLAPFPEQWKEMALRFFLNTQDLDASEKEHESLSNIEEFSELIPEIEDLERAMKERNQGKK